MSLRRKGFPTFNTRETLGVGKAKMTLVVNLIPPSQILLHSSSSRPLPTTSSRQNETTQDWTSLLFKIKCRGRFSCLFSDNRKEVLKFAIWTQFLLFCCVLFLFYVMLWNENFHVSNLPRDEKEPKFLVWKLNMWVYVYWDKLSN